MSEDENVDYFEITSDVAAHVLELMVFCDELCNETQEIREHYAKNSTMLESIKAVDDWAGTNELYYEEDEDFSEEEADILLIAYMQGRQDERDEQEKFKTINSAVVHIYDSPGPYHKIIGRLVFGDKVTVYETQQGGEGDPLVWCRVTDNEEESNGWVSALSVEVR